MEDSAIVDLYWERSEQANTAIFSAKTDEDQGFHYIPERDIKTLSSQCDSDFVITVMHHPHHVFNSCCKKELERAIYSCKVQHVL